MNIIFILDKVMKLNLRNKIKELSFDNYTNLIQNSEILSLIKHFLYLVQQKYNQSNKKNINIPLSERIYLCLYLIIGFPNYVLSSNRSPMEKDLYNKAQLCIKEFDKLTTSSSDEEYVYFFETFLNFINLFSEWKEKDKQSQIEVYTRSYYELEVLKNSVSDDDMKKDLWINEITKVQNNLRKNIKSLGGKKGEEYLNNYSYKIGFSNKMLLSQVRDTVYKAYWDNFNNELSKDPPSYKPLVDLLKEVKDTMFTRLIPNRKDIHKIINETLDISFIEIKINNGTMDLNDILNYADFIVKYLKQFSSTFEEKDIDKWFTEFKNNLNPPNNDFNLPNFLTELFRNIMARLEKIAIDTENFRKHVKNLDSVKVI